MARSKIVLEWLFVSRLDSEFNIIETKLGINLNMTFKRVRNATGQTELPLYLNDLGKDEYRGYISRNYELAFNLDYNTDFKFTTSYTEGAAGRGIGTVTIEANYDGANFVITKNNASVIGEVQNEVTTDPIQILSTYFLEASENKCQNVRVNVSTNTLAKRVLSPVQINPNSANPFSFDFARGSAINVVVQDLEGRQASQVVNLPSPLNASNFNIFESGVNTVTVGEIEATNGLELKYSLDNVNWQNSSVFTGLGFGTFTAFIKDQFGCSVSKDFAINRFGTYTKAFFIIRDFMDDSFNSRSSGISLKSFKVGGIETLTNEFFIENQIVSTVGKDSYYFAKVDPGGTNPVASNEYNSYNPFSRHLGTIYPITGGVMRGLPTFTKSRANYGQGVMSIGVDKPKVMTLGGGLVAGAFYIDIDFSKDLYIEFDIITNIVNLQVYEEPQVLRKYKIIWDKEKCLREFSYYSTQTKSTYQDSGFGFLKGALSLAAGESPFIDFSLVACGQENPCFDKERTRSYALFVDLPKPQQETPETITQCCYQSLVLADTDSNDDEKNDYTGIYHKRQIPNETSKFFLVNLSNNEEIELNDGILGKYKNFGDIEGNSDLKTFVVSWKKVLMRSGLGEGTYTILKRTKIAGIDYEESDINYTLKKYSARVADKTVRIDIKTNGLMQRLGIDFENSGFETSLRFNGFFGRREAKFEEDNITYSNFVSEQISMMQTNEYTLQSNLLPSCITQQVWDFLLFANDIYISDYNLNNHLRELIKFPVKFGENKGTGYFSTTTSAVLNLSFTDKIINNIKRNY